MVARKDERFARNIGPLSAIEQGKLARAKVGIVGLGGTGGAAFECCVRNGIGKFVIFDCDKFELSNFNRQLYAIDRNVGKVKVNVAAEKARRINPDVKIIAYAERVGEKNAAMLAKCDVVIDCTDNVRSRRIVSAFCRKRKIPYVFCSAGGSSGMASVFENIDLDGALPGAREPVSKGVLAQAAMIAGTLAAAQALAVLLGKECVRAPEFIFFDLFSERVLWKQKV